MHYLISNFVLMAAISQNVFYIHAPPNVRKASYQVETDSYKEVGLWRQTYFSSASIGGLMTPSFQAVLPTSKDKIYRFKIRLELMNDTIMETEKWTTIISESEELVNNSFVDLESSSSSSSSSTTEPATESTINLSSMHPWKVNNGNNITINATNIYIHGVNMTTDVDEFLKDYIIYAHFANLCIIFSIITLAFLLTAKYIYKIIIKKQCALFQLNK